MSTEGDVEKDSDRFLTQRRSILDQIESKASRQRNAPTISPVISSRQEAILRVPNPRMSELDKIELEKPRPISEKAKSLKKKDRTLEL